MITKYLLLLISSVFIGIACGIITRSDAITRGIVLTVCLSIGTIFINYNNRDAIDNSIEPDRKTTIYIGVISGIAAGFINYYTTPHIRGDIRNPINFTLTVGLCALYGWLLQNAYYLRWKEKNVPLHLVIASVICGVVRTFELAVNDYMSDFLKISYIIPLSIIIILTTTLPFCFLWYWIHALFDPAFTYQRWWSSSQELKDRE